MEKQKKITWQDVRIAAHKGRIANIDADIMATAYDIQEFFEEIAKEIEEKKEGYCERVKQLHEEINSREKGIARLRLFQDEYKAKIAENERV